MSSLLVWRMPLEDLYSLSFHCSFRSRLTHFKHLRMNSLVEGILTIATGARLI